MADKRNNRLLNAKLNKYIVPGIMMSLALQLGNIVDTIFVSNLIGVEAMSAVTMSLPVETIIQLTGYCLGIGGSIAVGNMPVSYTHLHIVGQVSIFLEEIIICNGK